MTSVTQLSAPIYLGGQAHSGPGCSTPKHMAAYAPRTPSLSPTYANIGRIVDIIERGPLCRSTTEIIRLKYGVAEDVVSMLNTLEKSRQGEGAEADKEAVLVADKRTNSVVVTADELTTIGYASWFPIWTRLSSNRATCESSTSNTRMQRRWRRS